MTNEGIPTVDENKKEEVNSEGFNVEKAVSQFDVTQKARKDTLKKVEDILEKAVSGGKVDAAETVKCLRGLYVVTIMQDALIVNLMGDLVRAIRSMAKSEVDTFNLTAKLFTITQALYDKQVVNVDDLEQIHQEVTIPTLIKKLKAEEEVK